MELAAQGLTREVIADRLGVSLRTVFRYLKKGVDGVTNTPRPLGG